MLPPWIGRYAVEQNHTDDLQSEPWTEEELELLRRLVQLNIPMDTVSNELGRSCTATILKAVELELNLFSNP
jgi:hypothetical protein